MYYNYHEYVSAKSKNGKIKPPVVDAHGDQLDVRNPPANMPNKSGKYKPGVCEPKTGKDWTSLGEKDLIYKPKTDTGTGVKPAKIPTAEQIQIARSMIAEIQSDPTLLETLVRTFKHAGMLGALIAEVFSNREATSHLAEILANENYGPQVMKSITRSLNEEVAKPFSDELDGTSNEDGEEDEDTDGDDPFSDEPDDGEDGEEGIGNGDEEGQGDNLQVGAEPDPAMMGGSPMDPSMMGMDPSMSGGMDGSMGPQPNPMMGGGMDPSMMGGDPNMMGMSPMGPPQMMPQQQQPQMPPMNPMQMQMQKFQRAMMRAHQRAMMRKN